MDALAEKYRAEDLAVRTGDGEAVGPDTPLKLTGQKGHGRTCKIYVKQIERIL